MPMKMNRTLFTMASIESKLATNQRSISSGLVKFNNKIKRHFLKINLILYKCECMHTHTHTHPKVLHM